jgi:signal transduction histidine kinase/ActR/RegA family two-component response regulator
MRRFYSIIIISLSVLVASATAQENTAEQTIDSLNKIAAVAKGDDKIVTLLELTQNYLLLDPEMSISTARQTIALCEDNDNTLGKADALKLIGTAYMYSGKLDSSLFFYKQSVAYSKEINYQQGMANSQSNIGLIYEYLGKYDDALESHFKSLALEEELENTKGIAASLNNIGNIYYHLEKNEKALEYYTNALRLTQEIGDENSVADLFNNIGIIHQANKDFDKAVLYFQSSLIINKELDMMENVAKSYNNLGKVYYENEEYDNALENYNQAIEICLKYNDKMSYSYANTTRNIGGVLMARHQYKKAREKFQEALEIALQIKAGNLISISYLALADLASIEKDYKNAFTYFKLHSQIDDSIHNTNTDVQIAELELGYKIQKQEKDYELAQKSLQIKKLETQQNKSTKYLLISIFLVVFFLIIFVLRGYRNKTKTNTILQDKTFEIEKINNELTSFNNKLEESVKERTQTLEAEVNERRKVDVKLKKALKNAEDANYLKNAFLANMSHEIRTPLNGIIGFSSLLVTELSLMENEEMFEYANGIQQSGERLLHLLNNILDISRIEANDMDINQRPCCVNEIIRNVSELYNFKANDKGIKFNTKLNDLPKAMADESKLTKIISDIIDNAIKYTEKGFINVVSNYDKQKGKINIIVKDTGIGIDQGYLEHVFEAFRQESLGYSRNYQGAGLGLPLAKRLLSLMDGDIIVDSSKGSGTTVTIIVNANENPKPVETQPVVIVPTTPEIIQETDHPKLKIFIVEDDRMNRLVLTKMLKNMGHIVAAVDGEETLKIIQESVEKNLIFDIMLFDINLPAPWDGIKLMYEIKKQFEEYKLIPFIAQTAYAMTGDKERLLEAGFDNYIAKPVNKKELITMIYNQLKISKN